MPSSPETESSPQDVRYEPNERPPKALSFGLGFQQAAMCIAGIVLTPAIVIRAAGNQSADYLSWAVFAALMVSGLSTILQAVRLGPVGAGYILLMGTSGAFIAVCVAALAEGGPALLATLVVISSLFQFALAWRLSLLRRIITPTVAGTVIMLIAVTVMPILFGLLTDVPEGTPPAAAPAAAGATIVVICALILRASGSLRLWVPLIGIAAGCGAASVFGLFDLQGVIEAPWIGIPSGAWPGFDLGFGASFWALLPAFVFVTLIGAVETIGDSIAVQRVSWRKPRAPDFQAVQGAVAADGVGNLLSGLAGTVPNTTYSSTVAITEITGVAARSVGVCIGLVFVAAAFLPKVAALLLAVPNPVVGAYLTVLIALLFVLGMGIVIRDGVDYRKAAVAGVSFWVGAGFQQGAVFAEQLGPWWGDLLGNGMTAGGLTAILLTLFLEITGPRPKRLGTALTIEALPEIDDFLKNFAARAGLAADAAARLRAVGEEILLSLVNRKEDEAAQGARRLRVTAQRAGGAADLEFVAAPQGAENLEDRIAVLDSRGASESSEQDFSLRLLRHFASSVRHQRYFDTDIVTARVDAPARRAG